MFIPLPPQQWAEHTFKCSDLGDKRRTKRLTHVAAELAAHTGSSLASSCEGNLAVVEGAYRLIGNEAVEPDAIAEAGFQATFFSSMLTSDNRSGFSATAPTGSQFLIPPDQRVGLASRALVYTCFRCFRIS